MHFIHSFIKNVSVWDPTLHFNISKQGSIFLERPEDDSIRIETCCPNTIKNIIKVCCVWLTHHCVFYIRVKHFGMANVKNEILSPPTNQWHRQLFFAPPLTPQFDTWQPTCYSLSQDTYIIISKLTLRSLTILPSVSRTELNLKKPTKNFGTLYLWRPSVPRVTQSHYLCQCIQLHCTVVLMKIHVLGHGMSCSWHKKGSQSRTTWPWRQRHHYPFKRWELLTQWHSVTSQGH